MPAHSPETISVSINTLHFFYLIMFLDAGERCFVVITCYLLGKYLTMYLF